MNLKLTLLFTAGLLLIVQTIFSQAGNDHLKELQKLTKKKAKEGWTIGGGLGFDFAQLNLINPKVGGGTNRIGFGGLNNIFANYKMGKLNWENDGTLQLSVQRLGRKDQPFQKNLDLLRLNSRLGFQTNHEKISVAADLNLETLLLKSYEGNLLRNPDTLNLIARFFSPARISFSPGLEFKPDKNWTIFASPIALRIIYVADDNIAALNLHGNEPGKNSFVQIGSNVKTRFKKKYLHDKMLITSSLNLYYNLKSKKVEPDTRASPKNLDVLWQNDFGWQIVKNFTINLTTELFWDADVLVQIDKNDDGVYESQGNKVSFTEALFLKYNVIF